MIGLHVGTITVAVATMIVALTLAVHVVVERRTDKRRRGRP